jgi:hypothetical protein
MYRERDGEERRKKKQIKMRVTAMKRRRDPHRNRNSDVVRDFIGGSEQLGLRSMIAY